MEDVWKKFEENPITHSAAHHLLSVMKLKKSKGYARVSDVARDLNITTGSASTNLKNLKQRGLVTEDDHKHLSLSEEGEKLAEAVKERKRLSYSLLTEVLGVSSDQADIDSCKIEHLLSGETARKLQIFLKER